MRLIASWAVLPLLIAAYLLAASERPLAADRSSCRAPCLELAQNAPGAGAATASGVDAKTLEKYGMALALGNRTSQFVAEIAVIRDAVARGDRAGAAAGVQALYKKAKRPLPEGSELDQVLGQLPPPDRPVPSGNAGASTTDPYAGSVGGGPTLPLGQGSPAPRDDAAGAAAAGKPSPGTVGNAGASTTDPYAGSVGGGPTLPLGQGSPAPRDDAAGGAPASKPSPGTVGSDDSPLGPPPTPTVKLDPCGLTPPSSSSGPITVNQLIGVWTDSKTGEQIEIEPDEISGRSGGIVIRGKHTWWNVSLQGQTLKACRTPLAEEMGDAPDWASQEAYGKIKWELELDATADRGQLTLEGKWYPGSFRWTETPGADASAPPKRTASDFGRGTPLDRKFIKPPSAISDVIVLTDQTTFVTRDLPKWPYASAGGDTRVLFVYGRGLPRHWSDTIDLQSEDPNVKYLVVALSADKNTHPARKEILEAGWREARKDLDQDTIRLTQGLDALLVYARPTSSVLPGTKRFTLNGADGSWRLRFGDDRASISFMRAITEDLADPTSNLILPERAFLEVRTGAAFPIESIPLKVALNGTPVTWGNAKTLDARRIEPTVYRTDVIEIVEAGQPMPATVKGVYFLPTQVKDQIDVRLEDPFLLGVTPASTVVRVLRTPGELGTTWKEALLRAAKADALVAGTLVRKAQSPNVPEISDWNQLSAAQATQFSNYELSPIILKTLDSATAIGFLRYVPGVYRYIQEIEKGKLRETTKVTVGDHAALLLFRDQFVRSMTAAADNLDKIKGEVALRGFREAIKLSAWDDDAPWRYLRVSCADGSSDCSFPMVVSDSYIERTFGMDRKAADEWVRKAIDEAIQKYREATRDAIAKAKDIKDSDIRGLMKLIGVSYLPLLPAVQARMMRLDEIGNPRRQLWVPDWNGRYALRNLHTVVEALQAQEDYSKLDTQMAMLMAAAVTAPFILEEGVVAAAIAWGTDTAFLGVSLATDVPEFIEQREEIHFALGASIILGTQRLQEAQLKKTEWFQLVGQLGPAVLGPIASTARMVGVVRGSLVLSAVERGGLKAFETLSTADKAAFWRYATEAELLQELGETKAITQTHRRALAATEKLLGDMGVKVPELPKTKTLIAPGEAGPLPKTQTLPSSDEPYAATIGFDRDGRPVQVRSGETVELAADPNKTPTLKAGDDKTPTLKGPEEPGAPKPGEAAGKPKAGGDTLGLGAGGVREQGLGDLVAMRPPKEGEEFAVRQGGQQIGVKLRAKLGEGGYAKAFLVVDSRIPGCARGCVIKIYDPGATDLFFGVGKDQVNYVRQGAVELGDDILQLKNLHYAPDAPQPYIIQELLGDSEEWMYFSKETWPSNSPEEWSKIKAEFRRRPELRSAVLDLFTKMRNKGLVWEDCHLRNIFFKKIEGKWVAGILDQDRIIKWTADRASLGDMGAFFGAAESHYMPLHLKSLERFKATARFPEGLPQAQQNALRYYREHPGPYLSDIDLFWEKSLERKWWLEFEGGDYGEGLLAPGDVENGFPRLRDRERLGPYDPSVEFNKPRQNSELNLNIVPFARQGRFASVQAGTALARAA